MIDLTNRRSGGEATSSIRIVGVGGAGVNLLNRMVRDGWSAAHLLAVHCDAEALEACGAGGKVQLGPTATRGLATGGDPQLGAEAAREVLSELRDGVEGNDVLFLLAGLGGGTGSGAAPVIAQLAREAGQFLIAVVTLPFSFEGERRNAQALEALEELRRQVDLVLCFENDRMGEGSAANAPVQEAFGNADGTMAQSVQALIALLTQRGLLHLGYDDLRAALSRARARCLFGYGEASGPNRTHEAVVRALRNPLMEKGQLLKECRKVLVSLSGGTDLTLNEVQLIMEELNRHIGPATQLLLGLHVDPTLSERLVLTLLSSLPGPGGEEEEVAQEAARREETTRTPSIAETSGLPERSSGFLKSRPETSSEDEEDEELPLDLPRATAGGRSRKGPTQETLQFEPVTRGRFAKSEPTIVDGQDLDVPTYLRYKIRINA